MFNFLEIIFPFQFIKIFHSYILIGKIFDDISFNSIFQTLFVDSNSEFSKFIIWFSYGLIIRYGRHMQLYIGYL